MSEKEDLIQLLKERAEEKDGEYVEAMFMGSKP